MLSWPLAFFQTTSGILTSLVLHTDVHVRTIPTEPYDLVATVVLGRFFTVVKAVGLAPLNFRGMMRCPTIEVETRSTAIHVQISELRPLGTSTYSIRYPAVPPVIGLCRT